MFWKLLVAIDLLIAVGYSRAVWSGQERLDRFDFISIPVGVLGMVGLVMYAFSLEVVPQVAWQVFLPVFVAWSAWEIAEVAKKDRIGGETVAGALPASLLVGFTSVAIYRLGGSAWLGV